MRIIWAIVMCAVLGFATPSRYLDNTILDYGTNTPVESTTRFAKDIVLINAQLQALADHTAYEQRNLEPHKCGIDDDGGEACPVNKRTCSETTWKTKGIETEREGTLEASAYHPAFGGNGQYCNDHWMSAAFGYEPSTRTVTVIMIGANPRNWIGVNCSHTGPSGIPCLKYDVKHGNKHSYYTCLEYPKKIPIPMAGIYSTSFKVPDEIDENKPIPLTIKSWGGGCSPRNKKIQLQLNKLPQDLTSISTIGQVIYFREGGRRTVPYLRASEMKSHNYGGWYFYDISFCGANGSQFPYVKFIFSEMEAQCPDGYRKVPGEKNRCVKDYTYTEYSCPAQTKNPIDIIEEKVYTWGKNQWVGPRVKDNDCKGNNIDPVTKKCPPVNVPLDNCSRKFWECPGVDDVSCYKNPNGSPIAKTTPDKGISGSFETIRGSAKTYYKKALHKPTCPDGYTLNGEICEKPAQKVSCPTGYQEEALPEGKFCVEYVDESASCRDGNPGITDADNPNNYDIPENKKMCIAARLGECDMGAGLNNEGTKCLQHPNCPTGAFLNGEGKCEINYSYSDYTCPAGYGESTANAVNNDCEGMCGYDECQCNSPTPPLDSCRRNVSFGGYETYEKEPLQYHKITGSPLNAESWGTKEDVFCGGEDGKGMAGCKGNVGMISGKDEYLCFTTNRGTEHCFKVAGCRFDGVLGKIGDEIQSFYVEKDQKTIKARSGSVSNPEHSQVSGSVTSTCRMNAHMGWKDRAEGFTAIRIAPTDDRRLEFWDHYMDGFIGFIDFIGELSDKQNADGWQYEDVTPNAMANQGFTAIDYAPNIGKTIYVNHNGTCGNASTILAGLSPRQISYDSVKDKPEYRRLGAAPNTCIFEVSGDHSYTRLKHAAKITKNSNSFTYMCSPYKCSNGQCTLAKCPIVELDIAGKGKTKVEFQGSIIPESFKSQADEFNEIRKKQNKKLADFCKAQTCDANRPYIDVCGYTYQPNFKDGPFTRIGGQNYKYVCNKGILAPDGVHCEVKMCPEGTKEDNNGFCIKK